jgi:ligand-binding sensor domain-containing protein/class 3 adenylate cyclase
MGFIWFGTEAGLGRFDGINIITYDLQDGIIGNNVGDLFIDKYGSIWIGTNSGLSIMFESEVINYNKSNGLPDDFIYGIEEDNDGNIWIATRYGGACKFVGSKIQVYNKENGFPSNKLSGLLKDSRGNLWFCSVDQGLIKYNGVDFITFNTKDGLISNDVKTIYEDRDGLLWIGTDKGVTTFNGKTFFQFSPKEGIPEEEISTIVQDSYGNIWLGLYSDGILRYDGRRVYRHTGLESNELRAAFVDRRGDIWFGTFLGGLNRLPVDWFEIYSPESGLTSKDIYTIAQDDQDKMYFGHYGKGVSILDNGKFSRLTTSSGLISNRVSSILFDSKKNLWFGTFDGITKFGREGKTSFSKYNQLKFDSILKIFEDKSGTIWIGSVGGVHKYDPKVNRITGTYSTESGFHENAWVNDIFEDKNGLLWFATHFSGILTYNGQAFGKIDTSHGLPINNIMAVTQDQYGYYWFATDGKGICRYNGNEFNYITEKDGLTSDVCYYILENDDELYIGTLNGISILKNDFSKENKEYKFRYITKNEGIPSGELNQGAYYKDNDGFLWFGLIKIDPNKRVKDDNLSVFLSEMTISDGVEEEKFLRVPKAEFHYEENNVAFEFYSISFARPEDTIFEFMLEGVEENWSKTKENIVTYRALPSGAYNFWVKAKNSAVADPKPHLLASFTIAAPFYKTWWFILSSVLIFLLFLYSLYFYKTYQVKKRNEALEVVVKDRTRELEIEKNKSDELLLNILPSSLVEELKTNGSVRPRKFNSVSIMFTDFKSFTYTTSVLPPEELVHELNDIFKSFDSLIGKYGLEKLKTIGDSYMAACGIPNELEDHAIRIVYAALDFQRMIKERNKTSPIKWEMRLGIHSGSVVAGVVGTKKFTYDIWGDTVNIASRMESSGVPGEINISGYTYMLVRDHFDCEYRGKVDTKGKGGIDMYFVRGINRNQISNRISTFKPTKSFKQFS